MPRPSGILEVEGRTLEVFLEIIAKPRASTLALTALLALGAAGCGDDDPATDPAPARDIVDVATEAGSFGTLLTALDAADLTETLRSEGPFTVFAPADEAFAALPPGTLEDLLRPENRETLVAILTFHVIPSRLLAADAVAAGTAVTLNGQPLEIAISDRTVTAQDAEVVQADVLASNGVIHIIDAVLLPE